MFVFQLALVANKLEDSVMSWLIAILAYYYAGSHRCSNFKSASSPKGLTRQT